MSKKSWLVCAVLAATMGCLTLQAKTFQEVRAAAEKGDADAQFELALYYSTGVCVKRDMATAEKWYLKAAAQGHVAARSTCLSEGYGVKKDLEKAGEVARRGAEAGDVWAQFCLGTYYGVKKNPVRAFQWFRKAAEQGNAWGQVLVGMAYFGISIKGGVPENRARGIYWWKKAAAQDHALGQFFLGGCHISGNGVPKDREKAVYWLRKAADQGCEPAKAALKQLGE